MVNRGRKEMKRRRNKKYLAIPLISIIITFALLGTSCGSLLNIERLEMPTEKPVTGIEDYWEVLDKGPEYGGTLTIASTVYDTLNPLLSKNYFLKDVYSLIYESLVTLDENYKPQPLLCETFGTTTDCKTWTYNLKKNVRWHDGTLFTAYDVKFTIDSMRKEQYSYYYHCVKNISDVTVSDTYTLVVAYEEPDSFAASKMIFPVLPRHIYQLENGEMNTEKNISPVGTGMYKLMYLGNDGMKLQVNENWHGEKKPYIEQVHVEFYKNLTEIINSQADVIFLKYDDISKGQGKIGYNLKKYANSEYEILAFNNKRNVFAEAGVRRAITYALNKDAVIKRAAGNGVLPCDLPVYPQSWLNPDNAGYFAYDISKAAEILEDSGWELRDGRWYKLVNGSGTYLEFECQVNSDDEIRVKLAEAMAEELQKANIIMKVSKVNADTLVKNIQSGKYDAAIVALNIPSLEAGGLFFTSGKDTINITGYASPVMDSYYNQLKSNSFDNQRQKIFASIREKLINDVPFIGLYFREDAVLFKKKVRGVAESRIIKENRLLGINNWYIPGSSEEKQEQE